MAILRNSRGAAALHSIRSVPTLVRRRDLAPNVRMKRVVQKVALDAYVDFFRHAVAGDAASVMHNADLLPPHFDLPVAVTWRETDEPLTPGEHDVTVAVRLRISYMPVPGGGRDSKRLTLAA